MPVNSKDCHGYSPIYIAIIQRHIDCFKVLLYHGADINKDLYQGWNIYTHILFRHRELYAYVKRNNCSKQLAMKFSLNNTHPRLLNLFFVFLMVFINLKL